MSHVSNRDDLQAINSYVMNRSAPAAGAPAAVVSKWQALQNQWKSWYPGIMSSFYVSDSDLASGKSRRNALMQNQDPDAWAWAQESAADKPGRKAYSQRADAPVSGKEPWKKKGLTYSGKYKTAADVKELQKRINAAGYAPPLKVDGKYGPGTQAGERWLSLQGVKADRAADVAQKDIAAIQKGKPPPSKKAPVAPAEPAGPPPAAAGLSLFGIPINVASVLGAAAGVAGGFLAGGPVGAAIGTPVGFLGAAKLFPEKPSSKMPEK